MPKVARPRPKPAAQAKARRPDRNLRRSLGFEKAISFLMPFGGAELCPEKPPQGRSQAKTLCGSEAVARLAAHGGTTQRRIPLAKP